ncbi:MAG: EAL domain-containing protein [Actinomycetales bacterium]|nr:EAL domain-containing protein [Actinomycetales bacterium]
MDRILRAYLVGGVVVIAGYLTLPEGLPRDVAYLVVGMSAVLAIVVGVRRHRPRRAAAWLWMAAGQLSWVVADTVYSWYEDVLGVSPFPSLADVYYLAGYGLIVVGLAVLVRARRRGRDLAGLVDSALITVALGLLSWLTIAAPLAEATDEALVSRLIATAYPLADIVLLAFLVRLLVGPGARSAAFWLLSTAVALLLVVDTTFTVLDSTSGYDGGGLDLLWLASYVLWGAAALHPSMTAIAEPGAEPRALTGRRLAALTLAVLVAPGALAVELVLGGRLDAWPVTGCSVVLFGLVAARMYLSAREIEAAAAARDLARSHLAHQAAHDSLTELANRAHAVELIELALSRAGRSGALVGLLFIDLDDFKAVNDTHGHAAGDEVLREAARRMRERARAGDTVGRLGGDEFVVLVEGPADEESLVDLAERMLAALRRPVAVGTREVVVGASIGVAVARGPGADAGVLLHEADAAAYRAKARGRGRVEIFDDQLRREHRARVELEQAIRAGLDRGEFLVHYQPIVDVVSGAVVCVEALLRWERPGHGLVPPDEFIPTAEMSCLICDLDRWVLQEATARAASWGGPGAGVAVAVNLSARHLADPDVVSDVVSALAGSGLDARRLVLEITETVLVDQPSVVARLRELRALGVAVSIDDFGTGYTSIAQLQHLAADSLKIDRSLVAAEDPASAALVRLVVDAGHAFGLAVIGEGVEQVGHLEALRRSGCDLAQGYLFARPGPEPDLGLHLSTASGAG